MRRPELNDLIPWAALGFVALATLANFAYWMAVRGLAITVR